ncbi:MAG: LLM class flavin-dependent oxidoreductase [Actinomycetota bacterium]|nr:LLM class flavin-dependent oxidoreductase [Actinomycetota bacterium]
MDVKVYSTCPQSKDIDSSRYLKAVADVSRWSEQAGCSGILVYTDNGIIDPWLVSQIVIESTERLRPLVAIQPVYMHPYSAAKMVASLAFIHGRAVCLNMLAGGFKNDLAALGDETPHDERYQRTVEYTQIMMGLLRDGGPITVDDRYYRVTNLRMTPPVSAGLVPEVLISGSSPAGLAASRTLGATAVKYPRPPGEEAWVDEDAATGFGVRVGIVARENADEAWSVAFDRFPEDRQGKITHHLAMQVSDSHWHHQLSQRQEANAAAGAPGEEPDPYWLGPFQNYKTFCPYLVGSYERVGQVLAHYIALGSHTFILDIPASEEELHHIGIVFDRAEAMLPNTPARRGAR